MEKNKKGNATFANSSELPTGLAFIEFSDEDMENMRKIVSNDLMNIEKDLEKQLYRLDDFLKKQYGVLFKPEKFITWFYDKKKISEWGENLPKISDDELIKFSKIYISELKKKCENIPKVEKQIYTYEWKIEKEKLYSLFNKLSVKFISGDTSFETFEFLFSDKPLSATRNKIKWLMYGKNKMPNKKSITDLIDILLSKRYISKNTNLKRNEEIKILNTLFSSNNGDFKFSNSNFTTKTNPSEYRNDLEIIVSSI